MTNIWSKKDLSFVLNQEVDFDAGQARMNSLDIEPNDFFIALKGNKDGHDYIANALENGASFAIASYMPEGLKSSEQKKVILVSNTYQVLLKLAKYRRSQSRAKFIAITGSNGKTSTKDNLNKVLSHFGATFATSGNFNNYLGVPLTLASMPSDVDYVIVEIGMSQSGEIKPLAEIVNPDISIITNIMPAHIGNFASLKEVAREKGQIFQGPIHKSIAIINRGDDQEIFDILKSSAIIHGVKTILTFGERHCDSNLLSYKLIDNDHAEAKIDIGGIIYIIKLKLIGKYNIFNLMAIILLSSYLDLNINKVIDIIEQCEPIQGRGKIIKVDKFGKKFRIIDDSYNANPGSMHAALSNFVGIDYPNKVAILGDMLELGDNGIAFHQALKFDLKNAKIYKFIAVGELMYHLYDILDTSIEKYHFFDYKTLNIELANIIKKDDMILLKGSKGSNIGEVVKYLTKS